jgi:hypothetical protein
MHLFSRMDITPGVRLWYSTVDVYSVTLATSMRGNIVFWLESIIWISPGLHLPRFVMVSSSHCRSTLKRCSDRRIRNQHSTTFSMRPQMMGGDSRARLSALHTNYHLVVPEDAHWMSSWWPLFNLRPIMGDILSIFSSMPRRPKDCQYLNLIIFCTMVSLAWSHHVFRLKSIEVGPSCFVDHPVFPDPWTEWNFPDTVINNFIPI